ncbi:MAG: hypothetical protein C5B50_22230 [Verrucomicrobia bacterium]|nr:MAG: hypothetical protein C5B50_22230 [Verrucomicrobiota bacterium]
MRNGFFVFNGKLVFPDSATCYLSTIILSCSGLNFGARFVNSSSHALHTGVNIFPKKAEENFDLVRI